MAQDEEGWVKLARKTVSDPIFFNSTGGQVKVLLAVLCLATWTPRKWDVLGHEFTLQPGELFISSIELARRAGDGVTRDVVRKAIKRFEKMGFWTIKSTKRGMLIHVVNWRKYQTSDLQQTHMETQCGPNADPMETQCGPNADPTNKKESKKVRKKEGKNIYSPLPQFEEFAGGNQPLLDALKGWADMRRQIKKPLTERAVSLAMKRLQDISGGQEKIMVAILDQSTMNNWSGLFPLKDNRREYSRPGNSPEEMESFKNGVEDAVSNGFWHG